MPQQNEGIAVVQQHERTEHQQEGQHADHAHERCNHRGHQQGADHLGHNGIAIRQGQGFPEQDAAIPAILVQTAQAIEEHHEAQYQHGPHHGRGHAHGEPFGQVAQIVRTHLDGDRIEIDAVDHEGTIAEHAFRGHGFAPNDFGKDKGHQGQQQGNAGSPDRCPEEPALVLPEFTSQQPDKTTLERDWRACSIHA